MRNPRRLSKCLGIILLMSLAGARVLPRRMADSITLESPPTPMAEVDTPGLHETWHGAQSASAFSDDLAMCCVGLQQRFEYHEAQVQ